MQAMAARREQRMARLSKLFLVMAVLIVSGFYTYQSAFGWKIVDQTNELFAVGTVEGTVKSYLYTIEPKTGETTLIGDTGLNNCTGIDFNSEGKLKAICETRLEADVSTKGPVVAETPVIAELDIESAGFEWAVPHGISNNISDITIAYDGRLFSYENLETDRIHRHEKANDFQAMLVGTPGIEAFDHGLATWGDQELKVAANVEGSPWYFAVDAKTAEVTPMGPLSFPDFFGAQASQDISTRVTLETVQFASMDSVKLLRVDVSPNTFSALAAGYAFRESQADFAALMIKDAGMTAQPEASTSDLIPASWAAIGLIDVETLQVDYIVEVQNPGFAIRAIALREIAPAQVPTLSEWGLISLVVLLGLVGFITIIRKIKLSKNRR